VVRAGLGNYLLYLLHAIKADRRAVTSNA